jgi:cell division septation protein DedD
VKERLTGAIILVALMVLLVPELLTGPVRSAPETPAVTPSTEGAPLRSYTIKLSDDAHARNAAGGSAPPEQPALIERPPAAAPPVEAARGPPPPAVADGASRAPSAAPAGKAAAPPATASPAMSGEGGSGAWVVQLGSFAQHANAERLARQVKAQGFRVSVSQESSGRRLYRVRVGPAQDRSAATQLATQLQAAGHRGAVVPK